MMFLTSVNEPQSDKTNNVVHLSIDYSYHPWRMPSLIRVFFYGGLKLTAMALNVLLSDSEDPDQTGPRLMWVFAGRKCHSVCFVMMGLENGSLSVSL